jgi:chorismate dehydratase
MIKIVAVSYVNTLPFIYGILNSNYLDKKEYELIKCIPSKCAELYLKKEADIVLVPSGTFDSFQENNIITNYCISAYKEVKSVILASQNPINQLSKIILDYQSITSVRLIKILLKYHWKLNIELIDSYTGYENDIKNDYGGVIIGDRALFNSNNFNYIYDLSLEWWKMTNLSFVFAYWAKTKDLPIDFLNRFNMALMWGVKNKKDSLQLISKNNDTLLYNYLKNNIIYELNSENINSLKKFYEYLQKL